MHYIIHKTESVADAYREKEWVPVMYSPSGGGDDLVVAIGGGVVVGEAGLLVVMFPVDSVCVRMICSTLSSACIALMLLYKCTAAS